MCGTGPGGPGGLGAPGPGGPGGPGGLAAPTWVLGYVPLIPR